MGARVYWRAVLAGGRKNPRLDILAAVSDAPERVLRLQAELTVDQLVGMANALFNACDPKDLREAAPENLHAQSLLAWNHLVDAKHDPRLGGRWAQAADALRPGATHGLQQLRSLSLEPFLTAVFRVVSQVYRRG